MVTDWCWHRRKSGLSWGSGVTSGWAEWVSWAPLPPFFGKTLIQWTGYFALQCSVWLLWYVLESVLGHRQLVIVGALSYLLQEVWSCLEMAFRCGRPWHFLLETQMHFLLISLPLISSFSLLISLTLRSLMGVIDKDRLMVRMLKYKELSKLPWLR